jgi:transcription antitermination factor NusG
MVAGHWNNFTRTDLLHPDATPGQTNHNARDKQADRDTVARYYKLYQLLISSENPHPSDMNLYIYSSKTTPSDPDSPDNKYQNLLGVTGYFEEVEQQKENLEVTNKYSTEKTKATIKKVWDDKNNQDGKRPESITVKLSNGESVTLNEKNNWEATIENLPKYDKGNLITYTWVEDEKGLPTGYKLTNTEVNGTITTITNSYTPEVRDIKVSKVWYDNDNEYEVRVKEVKVDYKEGDRVKITDGPFKLMQGTILDLDLENSKANVSIDLFGQETTVEVELSQIELDK